MVHENFENKHVTSGLQWQRCWGAHWLEIRQDGIENVCSEKHTGIAHNNNNYPILYTTILAYSMQFRVEHGRTTAYIIPAYKSSTFPSLNCDIVDGSTDVRGVDQWPLWTGVDSLIVASAIC